MAHTVASDDDAPLPRAVWFHWDGRTVLILSQKGKAKLRQISHSPRVVLSFNTDAGGTDVAVIIGDAHISRAAAARKNCRVSQEVPRRIKDLDMML